MASYCIQVKRERVILLLLLPLLLLLLQALQFDFCRSPMEEEPFYYPWNTRIVVSAPTVVTEETVTMGRVLCTEYVALTKEKRGKTDNSTR